MAETIEKSKEKVTIFQLPRNVWAVSLTSFFMDTSSEMVLTLLPLFLANVLGVQTSIIGLIEGIVGRIKAEYETPLKVIATGGLAPLFSEGTAVIERIDPDITLEGLRLLAERNRAPIFTRGPVRDPG